MRSPLFCLAVIAVALLALPSHAQYGGYGYNNGGWGGGTAAGNYAQGMASVIQSAGQAQLSNSQAAINYQDARSMEYDNRIKGTQTYFEMRRMNQAYTAAERSKPLTTEEAFRMAREAAPKRLSASQVDPITGAIAWPLVLRESTYDADRKKLEALYADRENSSGGIGANQYQAIRVSTNAMLATLKDNIKQYTPDNYIQAKRFLESLAYEAGFASN